MSDTSRAVSPSRASSEVSLAQTSSQDNTKSQGSLGKRRAADVSTSNAAKRARATTSESEPTISPSPIFRKAATSVSKRSLEPSNFSLTETAQIEAEERDPTMRFSKEMQDHIKADRERREDIDWRLACAEIKIKSFMFAQECVGIDDDTSQNAECPASQEVEWPEWVHDARIVASPSEPVHEESQ